MGEAGAFPDDNYIWNDAETWPTYYGNMPFRDDKIRGATHQQMMLTNTFVDRLNKY